MRQKGSLNILRFENYNFNSNCFLLNFTDSNMALVIDPGLPLPSELVNSMPKKTQDTTVLLTHEHYDHIAGVDELAAICFFDLYCSLECSKALSNPKLNMSHFMDNINPAIIKKKPLVFEMDSTWQIGDQTFEIVLTPGHSPGGICIFIRDYVFTGDTLLNGVKSPLMFPHSNRAQYFNSIDKLKYKIKPGMTIYPGHGEPFIFTSFDDLVL